MFACREHWCALPQKIRDAIWQEYRPGQEVTKDPSIRYLAVHRLALAYLVFKPHDEEAATEAYVHLKDAVRHQRTAVADGLGDPFAKLGAELQCLKQPSK